MSFKPRELDRKWQEIWQKNGTYKTSNDTSRPKCYVLDMFPYPSGSGLHVGHPLGYIASDIYARFKRQRGFNVLHPMGFDAFGLPAEQYAIDTGVHPSVSTKINTERYQEQMLRLGLSFDWDRAVNTSDPNYYKWTQWLIGLFFEHWYDNSQQKPRPIAELLAHLTQQGTEGLSVAQTEPLSLTAEAFRAMSAKEQSDVLMNYRLAFRARTYVNWCEALGTVLANDEVKDGRSERGNHPVEQRAMEQWSLRITAYAERLLQDLAKVNFSEGLKAQQTNWIGKSTGALVHFDIDGHDAQLDVFTTRPDTIFGVTFMVVAPEHELLEALTTPEQAKEIADYQAYVARRSERDRVADVEKVTGAFTGSYCINPINDEKVPIYISEYVLKDYGTGAIMAVPSDDERDKRFATKFGIPIIDVVDKSKYPGATLKDKVGIIINSGFMNGMEVPEAIEAAIQRIEALGRGKRQVNYRIRDLVFSRQRYWGEPWPIVYDQNDVPSLVPKEALPVTLPPMEDFRSVAGKSPLDRATDWVDSPYGRRETDTMPATAGSNWYYLRYMDPHNTTAFVGQDAVNYWQDVDLYVGGAEHAVSHILYSRLSHKFLYDLDLVPTSEPYKKLLNQGMIGGPISYIHLAVLELGNGQQHPVWVGCQYSLGDSLRHPSLGQGHLVEHELSGKRLTPLRFTEETSVDNQASFRLYRSQLDEAMVLDHPDAAYFRSILEQSQYFCWEEDKEGRQYLELSFEQGKMSKRKYNAVNPDDICDRYGADCFRMYEMFLGPIEQGKPWSTSGIDGVYRFLRKFWNFFFEGREEEQTSVSLEEQSTLSKEEMKVLHTLIQKVTNDIEQLSHNTCVSAFMVAANELTKLKCRKRSVLEPMVVLIAPFAPHIAEELWHLLGHSNSVHHQPWPVLEEKWLVEDSFTYPVAFNGKTRFTMDLSADLDQKAVEEAALAHPQTQNYLEGKSIRKVIVVPKRMVNIVI